MFDLSQLKEFNQGLVYGFEPESSPERLQGSVLLKDSILPETGQYQDMLAAYLFAQNHILHFIQTQGLDKISPELFLNWIKTLHRYIGKSLLEVRQLQSGEYTPIEIFRWHHSSMMQLLVEGYLDKRPGFQTAQEFAQRAKKELNVPLKDTLAFAKVLDKLPSLPFSILSASEIHALRREGLNVAISISLKKLSAGYYKDVFTAQEKAAIDKLVKVCVPIERIEPMMQDYARRTLKLWKACNPNDRKALAQFLSESFYELTEIHPFANANGRTATCLMNIMLRSFGLPSILLREPGENQEKNSSYTKAIDCINESRQPLAKHIEERIVAAGIKPFSDPNLERLICLRLEFADLFSDLMKEFPTVDLDAEYHTAQDKFVDTHFMELASMQRNDTAFSIYVTSFAIEAFKTLRASLQASKPKAATTLSDAQKSCNKLREITGLSAWKSYVKNDVLTILCVQPDREKADKAEKTLKSLSLMKTSLKRHGITKEPVIECTAIDIKALLAYQPLMQAEGKKEFSAENSM